MSMRRYTWRESSDSTSPFSVRATSMASAVLPDAVGPTSAMPAGRAGTRSAVSAEATLELTEREADDGGTPVHVVRGQLGLEQPVEQLEHLLVGQLLPRLDRGLARERHGDALVLIVRRTRQLAAGRE